MQAEFHKRRRQFVGLMADHGITSDDVAALLRRNPSHVRAWVAGLRPIPPQMLRLLELELAQKSSPIAV
jgi:hypothetical protein